MMVFMEKPAELGEVSWYRVSVPYPEPDKPNCLEAEIREQQQWSRFSNSGA